MQHVAWKGVLACKERKCGGTSASRDENGQVDVWRSVAAILGGPGGQRTPHFPEWGVTYKAVTPRF